MFNVAMVMPCVFQRLVWRARWRCLRLEPLFRFPPYMGDGLVEGVVESIKGLVQVCPALLGRGVPSCITGERAG